jgi:hypothetical protein
LSWGGFEDCSERGDCSFGGGALSKAQQVYNTITKTVADGGSFSISFTSAQQQATVDVVAQNSPIKDFFGAIGVELELAAHVPGASSYSRIDWIQDVTLTVGDEKPVHFRDGGGLYNTDGRTEKKWYKDDLAKYKADSIFWDASRRMPDSNKAIIWHADLQLVGVKGDGTYSTLKKMSWGFSLNPDGDLKREDYKEVQ